MDALISITTGEQGSPVVSARELYTYLEAKKQFADWIKSRIEKYGLIDGQDYTTFSLIGEKGRPTIEYALTIDAAKELAMVEGNAKGKAARQYFIEAEKALRRTVEAPLLSTEQILLQLAQQQTQLLTNQQEQLNQLRIEVDQIIATSHRLPAPAPRSRPLPGQQLALPGTGRTVSHSLRQTINNKVGEYCSYHNATTQETYNYLYKRMHDVYGVSVYRLLRQSGESLLDALERYGHLDKMYSLIMAELVFATEL